MANSLYRYREERGLTNEAIAEQLSALLGKPMSAAGVALHANRKKTPPKWADALGLPDDERDEERQESFVDAPPAEVGSFAEAEPPSPPASTRFAPAPSAPTVSGTVEGRIQDFYGMIGAGVGLVTQNEGYPALFDDYSPKLAQAWIAAGRENANVAKILKFLESGGPVGELIICHALLVGGLIYVSGRAPALGTLYERKFGAHHHLAAARAAAEHEAHLDGTGADGAAHPVADAVSASQG